MSAPDYSPELAGRLSKLESAISKQRTIKFALLVAAARRGARAHAQPVRAAARRGRLVRRRPRSRPRRRSAPSASRASAATSASRRAASATSGCPPDFDVEAHRVPRPWQIGERRARRGSRCRATPPGGCTARWPTPGTLEDGVFETEYAPLEPLAGWVLRQNGRAVPLEPKELRDAVADGLARSGASHGRERPSSPASAASRLARRSQRPPAGPVAPERFGVLQALLAHLLAACGEGRDAELDADDLAARFSIPREELQETLSLLNLVNFGGGCYTVYAEVDEDAGGVRVDKELYGDVFRRPPKLTPLEARAIRLAIEYVGPTIAAEAHTPLDRVRRKLEETFGQFELRARRRPERRRRRGGARPHALRRESRSGGSSRSSTSRRARRSPTTRLVEPYTFERELPVWRVHTWDRTADGPRTYRLDRMRSARLTDERFEPRDGLRPELPRGARGRAPLARAADRPLEGRARRTGSDRQGRARRPPVQDGGVAALRGARRPRRDRRARAGDDARAVAARAQALQAELGVSPRRKRTAERA